MKHLLRLYPAHWRERYGEEFEGLLEERSLGPREALDIVRGALDARLRTRATQQSRANRGMMAGPLRRDELRSELRAILAAREELGPEHEEHLLENFLDRMEQAPATRRRPSPGRRLRGPLVALLVAGSTLAAGISITIAQHGPAEVPPDVMSCAPLPRCEQVYITPLGYRLSAANISRQGYRLVRRWADGDGFTHAIWERKASGTATNGAGE